MGPPNRVAQALGTQTTDAPGPVTPPGGRTPPSMGPAQPKSPFGNMPVSTGSDEVRFKPDDLVRLGGELVGRLGDDPPQARRHVNAAPREVEAGAFTTFCAHLAHAYALGRGGGLEEGRRQDQVGARPDRRRVALAAARQLVRQGPRRVMFIVLTIMALLIAVFIMMMVVCAFVLAFFAAWVLIARITACAAATGIDVVGQMLTGNTNAFPDFFEATLWSGLGGAKGVADTGIPYVPEGPLNPGAPWGNRELTSITGQEGYGDDYVNRTNPIPADTGKELD